MMNDKDKAYYSSMSPSQKKQEAFKGLMQLCVVYGMNAGASMAQDPKLYKSPPTVEEAKAKAGIIAEEIFERRLEDIQAICPTLFL